MSTPEPAGLQGAACVTAGDAERHPARDHATNVIVIVLVFTVVGGHWSPDQVIALVTLILGALGLRTAKQA